MSKPISGSTKERVPLSRDRVLAGAITVADTGGIGALTIRTLAQELGVKPMSVYHYVANKDEIIDGIVDLVYAEIDLPVPGGDWRTEMRRRANSARRVLAKSPLGHPVAAITSEPRPGDAATPQRLHRHPARGGLLGGTDRPRLRPDRQLRLRVRPVGERSRRCDGTAAGAPWYCWGRAAPRRTARSRRSPLARASRSWDRGRRRPVRIGELRSHDRAEPRYGSRGSRTSQPRG